MEKKRLLKDLPIKYLTKGSVVTKGNGGFYVENGDTIYENGGSSDRGQNVLDKTECEIMDLIWTNDDWTESADLKHITLKAETDKIIISFKPLDLEQAQTFAKGLQHTLLKHYGKEENYIWNEFKGFTVSVR